MRPPTDGAAKGPVIWPKQSRRGIPKFDSLSSGSSVSSDVVGMHQRCTVAGRSSWSSPEGPALRQGGSSKHMWTGNFRIRSRLVGSRCAEARGGRTRRRISSAAALLQSLGLPRCKPTIRALQKKQSRHRDGAYLWLGGSGRDVSRAEAHVSQLRAQLCWPGSTGSSESRRAR